MKHSLSKRFWVGLALTGSLAAAACGGSATPSEDDPSTQSGADDPSTQSGEAVASATNLFSCGAALTCDPVCTHLGTWGDCGGDAECGSELLEKDEGGLLLFESRPGPGNYQGDRLVFLLGDGRAIAQTRSRWAESGDQIPYEFSDTWDVEEQTLCTVVEGEALGLTDVVPYPTVTDCVPHENPISCADLEALVAEADANRVPDPPVCDARNPDSDLDGVCDDVDSCPGGDDGRDADADGIPDACDDCEAIDDGADENMNGYPDACELTRAVRVKVVGEDPWMGWWCDHLPHSSTGNTFTGSESGWLYNSYLVFDLSEWSDQTVLSGALSLDIDYFRSPNDSEDVSLWDVTTATDVLQADGDDMEIFEDLASGNQYGSATVSGTGVYDVPLNDVALNDLVEALGSDFAVGVHVDDIESKARAEGFRFDNSNNLLVVHYVP